ncbi:MAG: alpha/beta hydrolase [Rhodospirillales bacterium]
MACALLVLGACRTAPEEQAAAQAVTQATTAAAASAQAPAEMLCMRGEACRTQFPLKNGLKLAVYRNLPLEKKNISIKRAVVVLHGSSRTAHRYFARATDAAREVKLDQETLVIAPRFSNAKDDPPRRLAGDLFWDKDKHWKRGDLSTTSMKQRIGSFAAMDELLSFLGASKNFPNLKKITVIGHSAGGQFIQRYVAGHSTLPALAGIHIRHVSANPGRYTYLNDMRPTPAFDGTFARPRDIAACPRYNLYEYGIEKLNAYMQASGKAALIRRIRKRDFVLLLGDQDTDPEGKGLPRNCRAMMQGRQRLERGLMFKAHLDRYFAPHRVRVVIMPGVSHSGTKLFKSPEAREVIFY